MDECQWDVAHFGVPGRPLHRHPGGRRVVDADDDSESCMRDTVLCFVD